MARGPAPPYQLVEGDRFNLCLGLLATFLLASCRHLPRSVPAPVRWQLNAYTNWNLAFIGIRMALRQKQWDPFLLVNSLSIVSAFRTAFAQGLDENMRKKLAVHGLRIPRPLFVALDHLVHTTPAAALLASVVYRKQRVHPMNSVYVLVLYTWFSFRQADGQLDVSNVYVPHPWKRAWAGVLSTLLLTPKLVDALQARAAGPAALCAVGLLAPWLAAKLDPDLRNTYNFECMLHRRDASGELSALLGAVEARRERALRGSAVAPGVICPVCLLIGLSDRHIDCPYAASTSDDCGCASLTARAP